MSEITSIKHLDSLRWNGITNSTLFSSYDWFSVAESIYERDMPVYHVESNRSGEEAASVCWVRRREPLPIRNRLVRFFMTRYLQKRPLMMCQGAIPGFSGLYFSQLSGDREIVLGRLIHDARRNMIELEASFLIFPYLPGSLLHEKFWGEDAIKVSLEPDTFLAIEYPNFEEYINSRRKSVRKDYRRHINHITRMGIKTRVLESSPNAAQALTYIRALEDQHRAAPDPWAPNFIKHAAKLAGKWIISEKSGEMIGSGLLLADGRYLKLTYLGIKSGESHVYFSLMYGALRYAIENRYAGIYAGRGAYVFKSRLGFEQKSQSNVVVYARNRGLKMVGQLLARYG